MKKLTFNQKTNLRIALLFLFLIIVAICATSCSTSKYYVVAWVTEDNIIAENPEGELFKTRLKRNDNIFVGDTLLKEGGLLYCNINAKN